MRVAFLERYTIDDYKRLDFVLDTLTPRERRILEYRFGLHQSVASGETLQTIGDLFELTRERIRQIEAKALRKLRHCSRSEDLKRILVKDASDK